MAHLSILLASLTLVALVPGLHGQGDSVALIQHTVRREQPTLDTPPAGSGLSGFTAGEGAEIFIETGPLAQTWVPCTLMKSFLNGAWTVRVMAPGPKNASYTDVPEVRSNYLRKVDPQNYTLSLGTFLSDPDHAKELAGQLVREASRRKRAAIALRKSRQLAKDAIRKGCPGNFIILEGNKKGADEFGRGGRNILESIDLCAADCNDRPECKAFEWDPTRKVCNLRKVAAPPTKFADDRFMFCQRFDPSSVSLAASNLTLAAPAQVTVSSNTTVQAPQAAEAQLTEVAKQASPAQTPAQEPQPPQATAEAQATTQAQPPQATGAQLTEAATQAPPAQTPAQEPQPPQATAEVQATTQTQPPQAAVVAADAQQPQATTSAPP